LSQEVQPEDIPVTHCGSSSWEDEWAGDWRSLDEELKELEAEKPAEIREYERSMQAISDAWLAGGVDSVPMPMGAWVAQDEGADGESQEEKAVPAKGPWSEDNIDIRSPTLVTEAEELEELPDELTNALSSSYTSVAHRSCSSSYSPPSAEREKEELLPCDLTNNLSSAGSTNNYTQQKENSQPRTALAPHLKRRQRTPSLRRIAEKDAADNQDIGGKDGAFACFTKGWPMLRT